MGPLAVPLASAAISIGGSLISKKIAGKGAGSSATATGNVGGAFGELPQGALGFSTSGGVTKFDPETNMVTSGSSANRKNALDNLLLTFQNQSNELSGLRGKLTPGFGALTQARVQGIQNARTKAIGNLRENLSRRRVLGSSFGADALTRAELEFGQAEAEARAESFLQELDATVNLTNQVYASYQRVFDTVFAEMNLEDSKALALTKLTNEMVGVNNQVAAYLATNTAAANQKAQEKSGEFIGGLLQPIAKAGGKAVGGLFGGGGGGSQIGGATPPLFAPSSFGGGSGASFGAFN